MRPRARGRALEPAGGLAQGYVWPEEKAALGVRPTPHWVKTRERNQGLPKKPGDELSGEH